MKQKPIKHMTMKEIEEATKGVPIHFKYDSKKGLQIKGGK